VTATIPLFGEPEPAERPVPKDASTDRPRWTKYRPKNPVKCDHCMAALAETDGRGPIAALARYSRAAGGGRELLCLRHAQIQRERDNLPHLKREVSA
jgi:hypothetical protein